MEWFVLGETLKPVQFRPLHCPRNEVSGLTVSITRTKLPWTGTGGIGMREDFVGNQIFPVGVPGQRKWHQDLW